MHYGRCIRMSDDWFFSTVRVTLTTKFRSTTLTLFDFCHIFVVSDQCAAVFLLRRKGETLTKPFLNRTFQENNLTKSSTRIFTIEIWLGKQVPLDDKLFLSASSYQNDKSSGCNYSSLSVRHIYKLQRLNGLIITFNKMRARNGYNSSHEEIVDYSEWICDRVIYRHLITITTQEENHLR